MGNFFIWQKSCISNFVDFLVNCLCRRHGKLTLLVIIVSKLLSKNKSVLSLDKFGLHSCQYRNLCLQFLAKISFVSMHAKDLFGIILNFVEWKRGSGRNVLFFVC